jgi:hypothetical protein
MEKLNLGIYNHPHSPTRSGNPAKEFIHIEIPHPFLQEGPGGQTFNQTPKPVDIITVIPDNAQVSPDMFSSSFK